MTPEDAIKYLECGAVPDCCCASNIKHGGSCEGEDKVIEAINFAQVACGKMIGEKPIIYSDGTKHCAICGFNFWNKDNFDWCGGCGQKIDWTSEENLI